MAVRRFTVREANPQKGERVQFLTDFQTDKGPSSGKVIFRDENWVCIYHSNEAQWFNVKSLIVEQLCLHHTGALLWKLT